MKIFFFDCKRHDFLFCLQETLKVFETFCGLLKLGGAVPCVVPLVLCEFGLEKKCKLANCLLLNVKFTVLKLAVLFDST